MRNPKLLNLLRDNLETPCSCRVQDGAEPTIYLYGAIDPYFGLSAEAVVRALNGIDAERIHLRINSPGGDVFEARAIATAIRQHRSAIIAHIDGIAASAASYVAIAAHEVHAADGAFIMVHRAWTMGWGNSADMRTLADLLDKIDATIAADYSKKSGAGDDVVRAWMEAETWFTAAEALDAKLIDSVEAVEANGPPSARWNLTAFANAPKVLTEPQPAPRPPAYDRAALDRKLALFERIAA